MTVGKRDVILNLGPKLCKCHHHQLQCALELPRRLPKELKIEKTVRTRRTRTQKKALANCVKQNAAGEVLKDATSLSKVLGNVMEFGNIGKIISCARRCWGVAHPSQRSLIAPYQTNDTICCSQDETGWNRASNGRSQRII